MVKKFCILTLAVHFFFTIYTQYVTYVGSITPFTAQLPNFRLPIITLIMMMMMMTMMMVSTMTITHHFILFCYYNDTNEYYLP